MKYEVTSPDGQRFEVTAPDGATQEQVLAYAQSQFTTKKLGVNMADLVPGQKSNAPVGPERPVQESSVPRALNAFGPAEAVLSMGTGAVGGLAGNVAGVARTLTSGNFGSRAGIQQGIDTARTVSDALTYRPRTTSGQEGVAMVGNFLDATKLAGLGPTEAIAASALAGPVLQQGRNVAGNLSLPKLPSADPGGVPFMSQYGAAGAASSSIPAMRVERAGQLPVPIKLTKGQAIRTFEQQQFEREAAKNPTIGAPLRDHFAVQNEQILQNFDAWVDQTGGMAGGLRATGQAVSDAVVSKANRAKLEVRAAYEKARAAGETQEPVSVAPLQAYLEHTKPESINAQVLASADAKLAQVSKNGVASINDLEELRKMVGKLGSKDSTNAHYSKELRNLIDSMTDGVGGQEYKRARKLRADYAKEFENVGVIDRLLSTKPGTNDRAVAYEDVFRHSILSGSLDDVRAVRRTLQTSGEKGQQAWRDLQGQTVQYLKEEITKSAQLDQRGNSVVSAHRLNTLVTELDKDGKLDFVFGKKGAQQIRDINDIAKDVLTAPPGSVNTSNTASVLIGLLDTVVSGSVGLPVPVGTAIHQGAKYVKGQKMRGRVSEALSYGQQQ